MLTVQTCRVLQIRNVRGLRGVGKRWENHGKPGKCLCAAVPRLRVALPVGWLLAPLVPVPQRGVEPRRVATPSGFSHARWPKGVASQPSWAGGGTGNSSAARSKSDKMTWKQPKDLWP